MKRQKLPRKKEDQTKRKTFRVASLRSSVDSLSFNHPSNACYGAYSKAEKFVKHRNNQFVHLMTKSDKYDSATCLMQEFKGKSPTAAASLKPSFYPRSQLTSDLSSQISLLNAYYNIGDNSFDKSHRSRTSHTKHKRKHSDKSVLGCHYTGLVTKLELENNKYSKTVDTDTKIIKRRIVRNRQERRSVDPIFVSELEVSRNEFPLRESLKSPAKKPKPLIDDDQFNDLFTVSPVSIKHGQKNSII